MGKRKTTPVIDPPVEKQNTVVETFYSEAPLPIIDVPKRPRRLHLHRAYAGHRSQENVIYPGVYTEDNPALYSQAAWLIDNGYGVWLD